MKKVLKVFWDYINGYETNKMPKAMSVENVQLTIFETSERVLAKLVYHKLISYTKSFLLFLLLRLNIFRKITRN